MLYIPYITLKYAFRICGHAPKSFYGHIMLFYSDLRSKNSIFTLEYIIRPCIWKITHMTLINFEN